MAAFLMFALTGVAVPAGPPTAKIGCLACHSAHYGERSSCVGCHRGDPRTTRLRIAHQGLIPGRYALFTIKENIVTKQGARHIENSGCRRCHTIDGRGNHLAADLDYSVRRFDPLAMADAIRRPALFMPQFHFREEMLVQVVNALFDAGVNGGEGGMDTDEQPRVIHFQDRDSGKDTIFVNRCGACHRLLTETRGGLGSGQVAPNLSGIFSPFFPGEYREKEGWNRENLKKWLDNPRQSRSQTSMRPVPLGWEEFHQLLDLLDEKGNGHPAARTTENGGTFQASDGKQVPASVSAPRDFSLRTD